MSCGWHQNAQPAAQLSGHQLTAEEKEVDQRRLGDQHLEKTYRQEESAGARKRQWQPTVCSGETCCPLFHKAPEDELSVSELSRKRQIMTRMVNKTALSLVCFETVLSRVSRFKRIALLPWVRSVVSAYSMECGCCVMQRSSLVSARLRV